MTYTLERVMSFLTTLYYLETVTCSCKEIGARLVDRRESEAQHVSKKYDGKLICLLD